MIAAVANAIFDATGVRLRRVPFRDARVLAALKAAGIRRLLRCEQTEGRHLALRAFRQTGKTPLRSNT